MWTCFLGCGGGTLYGVETPRADVSTCGVARERLARLTASRRCGNRLYNWNSDSEFGYASAFRGDAAGGRLYMRGWLPWVSWVRVEGGDGVDMWREKIEPRGAYGVPGLVQVAASYSPTLLAQYHRRWRA